MIISVGYRVKSKRGVEFRRWANNVLKQYVMQWYNCNPVETVVLMSARTHKAIESAENKAFPASGHPCREDDQMSERIGISGESEMQVEQDRIRLVPMTDEMYRSFFSEYENDPDVYLPGQAYIHYEYSEEKVAKYVQKQKDLKRIPLAILYDDEIVGEIIIKKIEPQKCAMMSIVLKHTQYKDKGIGTQAERLAVQYVFNDLDIPTLYADTIRTNSRSQHVLEKVGFSLVREDRDFKYYRIDRS